MVRAVAKTIPSHAGSGVVLNRGAIVGVTTASHRALLNRKYLAKRDDWCPALHHITPATRPRRRLIARNKAASSRFASANDWPISRLYPHAATGCHTR